MTNFLFDKPAGFVAHFAGAMTFVCCARRHFLPRASPAIRAANRIRAAFVLVHQLMPTPGVEAWLPGQGGCR